MYPATLLRSKRTANQRGAALSSLSIWFRVRPQKPNLPRTLNSFTYRTVVFGVVVISSRLAEWRPPETHVWTIRPRSEAFRPEFYETRTMHSLMTLPKKVTDGRIRLCQTRVNHKISHPKHLLWPSQESLRCRQSSKKSGEWTAGTHSISCQNVESKTTAGA